MKIGDKIKRIDIMGGSTPFTVHDVVSLEQHKAVHQGGVDYEVLVNGEWKPVPRVTIHKRKELEVCIACEG